MSGLTPADSSWPARLRGRARQTAARSWTPTVRRALAGAAVAAGLVAIIWLLPEWLLRSDLGHYTALDELARRPTLLDAYRQTVLKVLGGAIVGVGLYFTYRRIQQTDTTNRISEEGQVTERFTRAIDQLGSEHTAIQLGGIYALERIARDSPKDHATVMEVLSAFLRENATEEANTVYEDDGEGGRKAVGVRVRTAVQAAATALGRRHVRPGEPRINLRGVWLRYVDLDEAHLQGANLSEAHLERASLNEAHLNGASLGWVHLEEADLFGAHLEGANLYEAHLERANLYEAHLEGSLLNAHLEGAFLRGTDLGGVRCRVEDFRGAIIDSIPYEDGMPDPRGEEWPAFVAERTGHRPDGGAA